MARFHKWFPSLILALFFSPVGHAQTPCPQLKGFPPLPQPDPVDRRLVCTVPELYGPQGFIVGDDIAGGAIQGTGGGGGSVASFQGSFLSSINESVATQIALLPLVAPAAGISFVLDPTLRVPVLSNDSFGPIFSERASTLGRHRLAIGFSYQHLAFDALDGVNLHDFPTVFLQTTNPFDGTACNPVTQGGECGPAHDFITASNRIDLKLNQYTAFIAFGITKRIDLSVAIPAVSVSMQAAAVSSFVYNGLGTSELAFLTSFRGSNGVCLASNPPSFGGCAQALFTNSQRASGMGDLTVRIKALARQWEHAGLAVGLDVRAPTGDEKNFLGTGAIGIKPFAVWSSAGRISPHVNVGYEWNGKSILAGDVVAGTKDNLPSEFLYSAGIEAGINRHFTATLDLVGQAVINGARIRLVNTPSPGKCDNNLCANPGPPEQIAATQGFKGSYAIDNASLGVRIRPFGKLLVSASVQLKLDNGGLRSKAIPLVSATYTIH